jgi:hypothetical protein
VHPTALNTDLRAFPDDEIERVANPTLRRLIKSKK